METTDQATATYVMRRTRPTRTARSLSPKPTSRVKPRPVDSAERPVQLPLNFSQESVDAPDRVAERGTSQPEALPTLDCLTTNQVQRIVGVDRSTLFRWTKSGKFPERHKSGDWLRTDVEHWLTERKGGNH